MSGTGILSKEQEKFWSDLLLDKLELTGWKGTLAKLGTPIVIRMIDDNYAEKLPEPWKSYAMQLTTSVYLVMQDGEVTDEELEGITDLVATIIDEKVDIPLIPDEDEEVIFKHLVKLLASFALAALNKKKAEEL